MEEGDFVPCTTLALGCSPGEVQTISGASVCLTSALGDGGLGTVSRPPFLLRDSVFHSAELSPAGQRGRTHYIPSILSSIALNALSSD